jgi:HEPN domain-containing protein
MSPLTTEWIAKAEADMVVAQREFRARKSPSYDAACFHAQQCAEKYLKARLEEDQIAFPFTHNLVALLQLLIPAYPSWTLLLPSLQVLGNYAVAYRYPGNSAVRLDARDAIKLCREVRESVRISFSLPL